MIVVPEKVHHLHRKTLALSASLRRRQAKVPDSCSHEKKVLWRPPDIERETRNVGGLPPVRSLGRSNNVFLTKMDALFPEANYERSRPELSPPLYKTLRLLHDLIKFLHIFKDISALQ